MATTHKLRVSKQCLSNISYHFILFGGNLTYVDWNKKIEINRINDLDDQKS